MEAGEIEPAGALPGEKEGLSIAQPALERKNKDRRGEEGLDGRTRGEMGKTGKNDTCTDNIAPEKLRFL